MFATPSFKLVLIGLLICLAIASIPSSASAITAEIAKKCNALTTKAFPPSVIGNPAAGSAKGTGPQERAYYRKCVANKGNMDASMK